MLQHLARRIPIALATLVLITFVLYGLIRSLPGTPLDALKSAIAEQGGRMIDSARYEEMKKFYGLDRGWVGGYLKWLLDLARGDLGMSLADPSSRTIDVVLPRIGPTLLLSGTSILLAYLLSIPLGLWCGARAGSLPERAVSTLLYMLYSLPSFVAALFLLILFSVELDWLPLSGMRCPDDEFRELSAAGKAWDILCHMVLPVACFTYGGLAYNVRFIRSNLQDVLRQDFIRTARAKGLSEGIVVARHAFRNSLIPLVTLLGLTLPALLGGSVILEQIFGWRGMGLLLYESVLQRDYPVVMALVLLYSILVIAGNLLADLLYALVDPRIRCP